MTILALEFSSRRRTAAVLVSGATPGRSGEACEAETRETPAFSLIQSALSAAGVTRADVEVIAVGLGPGSSTGIRAAIAIAQGWQLGVGVPLVGRSSLEVLAHQLHAAGRRGRLHLAVDAQRQELHVVTCLLEAGGPRVVEPLRLESVAAVESWIRAGEAVRGPDLEGRLAGAGSAWPEARFLARLGGDVRTGVAAASLEPIHLRGLTFVKMPAPGGAPGPSAAP